MRLSLGKDDFRVDLISRLCYNYCIDMKEKFFKDDLLASLFDVGYPYVQIIVNMPRKNADPEKERIRIIENELAMR